LRKAKGVRVFSLHTRRGALAFRVARAAAREAVVQQQRLHLLSYFLDEKYFKFCAVGVMMFEKGGGVRARSSDRASSPRQNHH
jgi:hypothetical protein